MRTFSAAILIASALSVYDAGAQDKTDRSEISSTPYFSGEFTVGQDGQWLEVGPNIRLFSARPTKDGPKASVSLNRIIVPNGSKLELGADKGESIIVQLLSGDIALEIDEKSTQRMRESTLVIDPGERRVLVTGDDAAVLRVTRVKR